MSWPGNKKSQNAKKKKENIPAARGMLRLEHLLLLLPFLLLPSPFRYVSGVGVEDGVIVPRHRGSRRGC
jgi:hypothetical protein